MARIIHSVSISPELSLEMKAKKIRPSDAFKRGVMSYIREADFTNEDNPLLLKEKIAKMSLIIENKNKEYELLKHQFEQLRGEKSGSATY